MTRPLRQRRHGVAGPRIAHGMTLVELMAVLAIAAILVAVAAPEYGRMLRQHRLKAATTSLFSALEQTRAQAIARGGRVMLVPADRDGITWSAGWIVMVDKDGDRRPGPDDEIITRHPALDGNIAVSSVFTAQKAPYYVAFNGAGRSCPDSSSVAARWGSFTLSDGAGDDNNVRRIRLSMLGRARICDPRLDGASCGASE